MYVCKYTCKMFSRIVSFEPNGVGDKHELRRRFSAFLHTQNFREYNIQEPYTKYTNTITHIVGITMYNNNNNNNKGTIVNNIYIYIYIYMMYKKHL